MESLSTMLAGLGGPEIERLKTFLRKAIPWLECIVKIIPGEGDDAILVEIKKWLSVP